MFSCLIFNINCGIRNVLELVSVVSLCHMSRLHSSHVTAEAELHPDIVCDVCGAPAANTEQHREACVCVCACVSDTGREWKMEMKPRETVWSMQTRGSR